MGHSASYAGKLPSPHRPDLLSIPHDNSTVIRPPPGPAFSCAGSLRCRWSSLLLAVWQ